MIAVDTNILVYADASPDFDRRSAVALQLIERLSLGQGCIPVQVLGEFLNVSRRKGLIPVERALERIAAYALLFETPITFLADLERGAGLADDYRLQFFDAVIISVAQRAGATLLLSEDMHDGLVIDGLTIINPFVAANESVLSDWLGSAL